MKIIFAFTSNRNSGRRHRFFFFKISHQHIFHAIHISSISFKYQTLRNGNGNGSVSSLKFSKMFVESSCCETSNGYPTYWNPLRLSCCCRLIFDQYSKSMCENLSAFFMTINILMRCIYKFYVFIFRS